MEYYSNFKKYDSAGRKVSIFGKQIGQELEIVYFICSKKDSYSKKTVKELYHSYLTNQNNSDYVINKCGNNYKFNVVKLNILNNNPQFVLNKYANENYYNLVVQSIKWEKADDKHIVKCSFNHNKRTLTTKTLSK